MSDRERFEDLADRLDAIEEEVRDLAYEHLAAAARDPDSDDAREAAAAEKRLNQARRAVAKAAAALRGRPPDAD